MIIFEKILNIVPEVKMTNSRILWTAQLMLLGFLSGFVAETYSQQLVKGSNNSLNSSVKQTQTEEEEDFIKPARPTIANPAEIQMPGVLQIEFGYGSFFRSSEFRIQQSARLTAVSSVFCASLKTNSDLKPSFPERVSTRRSRKASMRSARSPTK